MIVLLTLLAMDLVSNDVSLPAWAYVIVVIIQMILWFLGLAFRMAMKNS